MMMRQAEVAWSPSGTIRMMCALLLSVLVTTGEAFLTTPALVPRSVGRSGLRALVPHRSLRSGGISMTGGEQRVQIEKDEDAVGIALCDILKVCISPQKSSRRRRRRRRHQMFIHDRKESPDSNRKTSTEVHDVRAQGAGSRNSA